MSWEKLIPGCFGIEDKIFAAHPKDKERAAELLRELVLNGTDWSEAKSSIENWLNKQTTNKDHIQEQMKRVEKLYRPWLEYKNNSHKISFANETPKSLILSHLFRP